MGSGDGKAWTEAVEAFRNHAKLGKSMQAQGLRLMQGLQNGEEVSVGVVQELRELVRTGIKIEGDALLEIYRLERNKPKRMG